MRKNWFLFVLIVFILQTGRHVCSNLVNYQLQMNLQFRVVPHDNFGAHGLHFSNHTVFSF